MHMIRACSQLSEMGLRSALSVPGIDRDVREKMMLLHKNIMSSYYKIDHFMKNLEHAKAKEKSMDARIYTS